MKFNIIGSCVSRDIFAFSPSDSVEMGFYVARTSLASAFPDDAPVANDLIGRLGNIESAFQRRVVEFELLKSLEGMIKAASACEPVLLDLIDERFDLLRISGRLYTRSSEFLRLGLDDRQAEERLSPDSSERIAVWEAGARRLVSLVGVNRLILNKVFWATRDVSGNVICDEELAAKNNALLTRMYDFLQSLGVGQVIEYPESMLRVDAGHKWGLSHFHYQPELYKYAMNSLEGISSQSFGIASSELVAVSDCDFEVPNDYSSLGLGVVNVCDAGDFEESISDVDAVYQVASGGAVIPVILKGMGLANTGKHILVCFSGAMSVRGDSLPPYFSGLRFYQEIGIPLLAFSDPVFNLNENIKLGWYAGNALQPDIQRDISRVIEGVCRKLDLVPIMMGGSGGGFATLVQLGLVQRPAKGFIWNPQTRIEAYIPEVVAEYLATAFPGLAGRVEPVLSLGSADEKVQAFAELLDHAGVQHRVQCNELVEKPGVSLVYVQNETDWHLKQHASPWAGEGVISNQGDGIHADESGQICLVVGDWGQGHAVPPRDVIVDACRCLVTGLAPLELAKRLAVRGAGHDVFFDLDRRWDGWGPKINAERRGSVLHIRVDPEYVVPGIKYSIYACRQRGRVASIPYQESPDFVMDISGLDIDGITCFARDSSGSIKTFDLKLSSIVVMRGGYIPGDFRPDGVEVFEGGCRVNLVPMTGGISMVLANGGVVDWKMEFPDNPKSGRMWLASLDFIGRISAFAVKMADKAALNLALQCFQDFCRFTQIDDGRAYIDELPSSADHAAATRIKVLCKLWQVADDLGVEVSAEQHAAIVKEVIHTGNWLSQDGEFHANNHGVMGAISLILASRYLDEENSEIARGFRTLGVERLLRVARMSFDKDGLCYENTIGYHRFNLDLYRDAHRLLNELLQGDESVVEFEEIVERGGHALLYCLRQDGSIPPVGDSPAYATSLVSINESKWFPDSGYLVVKDDDFYLSLICGSRSEFHKQMDDSSITLRYKGRDILVDGGSYSYDRRAGHGRYVESCSAHSGIFPQALDERLRREVLSEYGRIEGGIHSYQKFSWGEAADCHYGIRDKLHVRRSITVRWPASVQITDVVALNKFDSPVTQRLLLGPDFVPAYLENGDLRIVSPELSFTIRFTGSSAHRLENGILEPRIRGWYSINFGEIEKTWFLERTLNAGAASISIELDPS